MSSSDEEPIAKPMEAVSSDSEDDAPPPAVTKAAKKGKKKAAPQKQPTAADSDDDSDDEGDAKKATGKRKRDVPDTHDDSDSDSDSDDDDAEAEAEAEAEADHGDDEITEADAGAAGKAAKPKPKGHPAKKRAKKQKPTKGPLPLTWGALKKAFEVTSKVSVPLNNVSMFNERILNLRREQLNDMEQEVRALLGHSTVVKYPTLYLPVPGDMKAYTTFLSKKRHPMAKILRAKAAQFASTEDLYARLLAQMGSKDEYSVAQKGDVMAIDLV
jgi:hypothetical protein